jgi:hypothetical protein
VVNLITNWDSIEGFWDGLAAFGAGAGALTAALGPAGAALGGALVGATNNIMAQTGANFAGFSNLNWRQVGLFAGVGAISGIAGYGEGQLASKYIGNVVINGLGVATRAIGGYAYAKENGLNPWTGKTLYRAVSKAEYIDMQNNGLRPKPGRSGYQNEKLFYESRQDAIQNTKAYDAAYGQQSIIKINSPNIPIYNSGYMDGFNVIRVNTENLYLLKLHK